MTNSKGTRHLVTLGMFIIDEFSFMDDNGQATGETRPPQIGGGGTYASIGARIWSDFALPISLYQTNGFERAHFSAAIIIGCLPTGLE